MNVAHAHKSLQPLPGQHRHRADCVLGGTIDAAIYASNVPVSATTCTIENSRGAGIKSYLGSRVRLEDCTFRNNAADIVPSSASDRFFSTAPGQLTLGDGSAMSATPEPLAAASGVAFLAGLTAPAFVALRQVRGSLGREDVACG